MVSDVSRTSFLLGFLLVPRALFVETAPAAEPVSLLVEAGMFGDLGGWVVDPSFPSRCQDSTVAFRENRSRAG